MDLPPLADWIVLNKANKSQIVQDCQSWNAPSSSTQHWCAFLALMPQEAIFKEAVNWTHLLSNSIMEYHQAPHPFHSHDNASNFSTGSSSSSSNLPAFTQRCYDEFWCPPHTWVDLTNTFVVLLGILGFLFSLLGLAGNIVMIPVMNLLGIAGSSSVFFIFISVVDILWIVLSVILTFSLYLPTSASGQLALYQNFQAYLVPLLWPLKQFLESLTLWYLLCFLCDRVWHLHQSKLKLRYIFNQLKILKICLIVLGVVGLLAVGKFFRYRVVDDLLKSRKILTPGNYNQTNVRIGLTSWGSSGGFNVYLICMLCVDVILPVTLILLVSAFLLYTIRPTPFQVNAPPIQHVERGLYHSSTPDVAQRMLDTPPQAVIYGCGGSGASTAGTTAVAAAGGGIKFDSSSSSSTCSSESKILTCTGPFLIPPAGQKVDSATWRDLTREQKVKFREGVFMQISFVLAADVILCKIPYFTVEVGRLFQPSTAYQPKWFIFLAGLGECMSLMSIVLKPLIYLTLAPILRDTLRDMLRLVLHPNKCHSISLSGGMGQAVKISSCKSTPTNSRGTSAVGSCTSLSQLKRNNTVMSLMEASAKRAVVQYAITQEQVNREDVEENVRQYFLSKQGPFLTGRNSVRDDAVDSLGEPLNYTPNYRSHSSGISSESPPERSELPSESLPHCHQSNNLL